MIKDKTFHSLLLGSVRKAANAARLYALSQGKTEGIRVGRKMKKKHSGEGAIATHAVELN